MGFGFELKGVGVSFIDEVETSLEWDGVRRKEHEDLGRRFIEKVEDEVVADSEVIELSERLAEVQEEAGEISERLEQRKEQLRLERSGSKNAFLYVTSEREL